MPCRYNYTGRGDGEDGDFMWCACTVIATEKVPKDPRSIYKEGEVHYPIYDVVHGYSARQCTMSARCMQYTSTQAVLVRWDADDRVEPRGGDRERQELLKSRWSKSHGEGAWRLDLDHISRGRHRTGSVFKVPVFVVPQLATLAFWAYLSRGLAALRTRHERLSRAGPSGRVRP